MKSFTLKKQNLDTERILRILRTDGLTAASSLLMKLFRYALLIGVSYVAIYPLLKCISMALLPAEEYLGGNAGWIPENPTLVNFQNFKVYFDYWKHAIATAIYTVVSTAIQLVITSLVGYGLGRFKFKGNILVFFCVIATIVVPIQTIQIPVYMYFRYFDFFGLGKLVGLITGKDLMVNLLNTNWSYYVPALFGVGLNSGLYIFLFRQYFKGMPRDLEDAARVDGCNPLGVYLRIMVPNIKPVFVTVALLSAINYWNDYTLSDMFMNAAETPPIMVGVSRILANVYRLGEDVESASLIVQQNATMLVAVAPLVILFLICQKFFVECMDRSGVKG